MKSVSLIGLLIITSCQTFDERILSDARYSSGRNYETRQPITPRIRKLGEYTFVSGYSKTGSSLGMYLRNKEVGFWLKQDGFYDTLFQVDFMHNGQLSFLYTYLYEDGGSLYLLRKNENGTYQDELITEEMHLFYCEENLVIDSVRDFLIYNVNGDTVDEILINPMVYNGKVSGTNCTDTFYFNPKNSR